MTCGLSLLEPAPRLALCCFSFGNIRYRFLNSFRHRGCPAFLVACVGAPAFFLVFFLFSQKKKKKKKKKKMADALSSAQTDRPEKRRHWALYQYLSIYAKPPKSVFIYLLSQFLVRAGGAARTPRLL